MDIKGEKAKSRKGFWKRQFSSERTRPQLVYDALFGIIAPILCFWFDPIVFQNFWETDNGFLGRYKLLVYFSSAIAIVILFLWLFYGVRLKRYAGFISGILFSGAIFSGGIGLLIFPISLIGLIIFIGVFGFIPFFTAFTYWRNGFRAFRLAESVSSKWSFITTFLVGISFICVIPTVTDLILAHIVENSMETIISGDSASNAKEASLERIKRFNWYIDTDNLRSNYFSEENEDRKENLAKAYRTLTNRDINYKD